MAVMITEDCIDCNACEAECPNTAIYSGGEPYYYDGETREALSEDLTYIVPEKCTECVGYYDEPQCIESCPTEAIVKDERYVETEDVLMAKKDSLELMPK